MLACCQGETYRRGREPHLERFDITNGSNFLRGAWPTYVAFYKRFGPFMRTSLRVGGVSLQPQQKMDSDESVVMHVFQRHLDCLLSDPPDSVNVCEFVASIPFPSNLLDTSLSPSPLVALPLQGPINQSLPHRCSRNNPEEEEEEGEKEDDISHSDSTTSEEGGQVIRRRNHS